MTVIVLPFATANDEQHIKQLIEQLLFTMPGERVNLPDFGTPIAQLVFSPGSEGLIAATQFMVQGAWGVLLSRYSGDHDVVFGATVAGRSASVPDIENMVGLFINTLPVRVRIDWTAPLLDWLHQLQEEQVAQRRYEHISLAEIQGHERHVTAQMKTLLMPGGLGSTHKVLLLGKGVGTPALRGCSFSTRVT